jgi:hypothetical protein
MVSKIPYSLQCLPCFTGNNGPPDKGTVLQAPVHTALPQSLHHVRGGCGQGA